MNFLVKVAVVAICLVVCGTATVIIPSADESNDHGKGAPIPVTNGQKPRSFWLTV
jgi:hypothetical protein